MNPLPEEIESDRLSEITELLTRINSHLYEIKEELHSLRITVIQIKEKPPVYVAPVSVPVYSPYSPAPTWAPPPDYTPKVTCQNPQEEA